MGEVRKILDNLKIPHCKINNYFRMSFSDRDVYLSADGKTVIYNGVQLALCSLPGPEWLIYDVALAVIRHENPNNTKAVKVTRKRLRRLDRCDKGRNYVRIGQSTFCIFENDDNRFVVSMFPSIMGAIESSATKRSLAIADYFDAIRGSDYTPEDAIVEALFNLGYIE